MVETILGTCGLVCSDCRAYLATQAGDPAALERVAAEWRQEYNAPGMAVADVLCDGCRTAGHKCSHCAECDLRACAEAREVPHCGACPDYGCAKLQRFWGSVPQAREVLDAWRASQSQVS